MSLMVFGCQLTGVKVYLACKIRGQLFSIRPLTHAASGYITAKGAVTDGSVAY